MELRLHLFGEDVLRQPGERVTTFDKGLRALAEAMIATMYASRGIGLAAQQVGHPLQLCVVDTQTPPGEIDFAYTYDGKVPPLDLLQPLVLVNPEVAPLPGDEAIYEEGCLSFPEIVGDVIRPEQIRVRFQDLDGAEHVLETGGLLARVVQHEVDHLNGVLFIDRMEKRVLRPLKSAIRDLEAATRSTRTAP